MSHILIVQASLDAWQWRLISDIKTALHQNKSKAAEAIKIAKACYMGTICEAEAVYVMAIKEAETSHSTSIVEAEGGHLTAIRDVEATCVAHALELQQAHGEAIRTLENEAIKEEGQAHQSFLWACRAALQACPTESLGILMYPIQLLMGNMSLTGLLTATQQHTTTPRDPIPLPSHSARPTMVAHSMGTKQPHSWPRGDTGLDRSGDEPA